MSNAQRALPFQRPDGLFGTLGTRQRLPVTQDFRGYQHQRLQPAFLLSQDMDARLHLARLLWGMFSVIHKQYGVASGIEGFEDGVKNVGAHRTHDGQIETVGIKIAADVTAHEGKRGSVPFSLPTVHHGAGEVSVV